MGIEAGQISEVQEIGAMLSQISSAKNNSAERGAAFGFSDTEKTNSKYNDAFQSILAKNGVSVDGDNMDQFKHVFKHLSAGHEHEADLIKKVGELSGVTTPAVNVDGNELPAKTNQKQ